MSEEIMRQNLMVLAQTYANARGWALATVSKEIHGNHQFLERYLAGEMSTTIKTYFLMVNRMRAKWPRGTPWPRTAPVPKLGKKVDKGFDEG
jgi:hypothetical protein